MSAGSSGFDPRIRNDRSSMSFLFSSARVHYIHGGVEGPDHYKAKLRLDGSGTNSADPSSGIHSRSEVSRISNLDVPVRSP